MNDLTPTPGPVGVLATIDGALHDYETSNDAMRWTPEQPPAWKDVGTTTEGFLGLLSEALSVPRSLIQPYDDNPGFVAGALMVEGQTLEVSFAMAPAHFAWWLRVVAGYRGKAFRRWVKTTRALHRAQGRLDRLQRDLDRLRGSYTRAAYNDRRRARRRRGR